MKRPVIARALRANVFFPGIALACSAAAILSLGCSTNRSDAAPSEQPPPGASRGPATSQAPSPSPDALAATATTPVAAPAPPPATPREAAGTSASAEPTESAAGAEKPFARTWTNHPSSIASSGVSDLRIASAGRTIKRSPLENQPGYPKPSEEDLYYMREGRLPALPLSRALETSYPSAVDLAKAVIERVNAGDVEGLRKLAITFDEFRTILWPEFPESRPSTNIAPEDAWGFLFRSNLSGSQRAADDWVERTLTFERVAYEVGLTRYTNFNLYRGLIIHAKAEDGREVKLDFTRTLVERDGRWKVYCFSDRATPGATDPDAIVPGHP